MTTSGTSNFFIANSDVILEAFDRCEIRPSEITRERMFSCKRSLNLELQTWSNRGINLWKVQPVSIPMIAGTATYTLAANVISLLDVYITIQSNSVPIDRILTQLSRTEYAEQSNKTTPGFPTTLWLDRQTPIPTITMWPVPDNTTTYILNGWVMVQVQDASAINAQTADMPYRFNEALCAGLAMRLAMKYAPSKFMLLKAEYREQWEEASVEDREKVPVSIIPDLSGYYRM